MNTRAEVKQLSTLFKYVSNSPEVVDGIFLDHRIRFTQPAALNDPLEFNPAIRFDSDGTNFKFFEYRGIKMPSIHVWHMKNLIESRMNKFGILSLTDNPYSFEMWCHYANGHKGFLLEFDISDKAKPILQVDEGASLRAHKVRYVNDYAINIDKLAGRGDSIPFHRIRDAIFLRKTKHWKYEREYRIVRQLADCDTYQSPARKTSHRDEKVYLFLLSLSCISNVVFGVNTSQEVKRKIINSCRNTGINFLQTIIYKDLQNKIDFIPIDSFGPIDKYLDMIPQIFVADSITEKDRDTIIVNSLHEIPYYHLQPSDWDDYYEKRRVAAIEQTQ
ncbi:MAG: DUF2971 domain-containing protein [Planctomycetota bacterium]|nr:DUF2971 domain-containing protein [Planctomycetota bacterium]